MQAFGRQDGRRWPRSGNPASIHPVSAWSAAFPDFNVIMPVGSCQYKSGFRVESNTFKSNIVVRKSSPRRLAGCWSFPDPNSSVISRRDEAISARVEGDRSDDAFMPAESPNFCSRRQIPNCDRSVQMCGRQSVSRRTECYVPDRVTLPPQVPAFCLPVSQRVPKFAHSPVAAARAATSMPSGWNATPYN